MKNILRYTLTTKHPKSTDRHFRYVAIAEGLAFGNIVNVKTLTPSSSVSGTGKLSSSVFVIDVNPKEELPKNFVHYEGTAYELENTLGKKQEEVIAQMFKFLNIPESKFENAYTYVPSRSTTNTIVQQILIFEHNYESYLVFIE